VIGLGLLTVLKNLGVSVPQEGQPDLFKLVLFISLTLLMYGATWFCYRVARVEFGFKWGIGLSNWHWFGLVLGFALGAGGQVGSFLIMQGSGYGQPHAILGAVTFSGIIGTAFTALAEEILFRLCLFQISAKIASVPFGLVASSTLFGAVHVDSFSAGYGLPVGIAIIPAFLGGLMFAYAYRVHQKLWLPVGLHFGWNYLDGILHNALVPETPPMLSLLVKMAMVVSITVILVEWMLWQRRQNQPQISTVTPPNEV